MATLSKSGSAAATVLGPVKGSPFLFYPPVQHLCSVQNNTPSFSFFDSVIYYSSRSTCCFFIISLNKPAPSLIFSYAPVKPAPVFTLS